MPNFKLSRSKTMSCSKSVSVLVRGAKVWIDGAFLKRDVLVEDGRLVEISDHIDPREGVKVVAGEGKHLLPGLVDLHVHFREPGFSYKETIASGSRAAARGGFTTVCTMPNLNPAPDSLENLQQQLDIIERDSCIEVLPFATITRGRSGEECVDFKALAPRVAGFSDDGKGVQSAEVMEKAMNLVVPTGKMIAAHCEVESLLNGGYIHDGVWCREHGHRGICSESEWAEVKRDIELAERTGCRLHICHISTKESVALIRDAKSRGVKVSCETAPHYLALCDEDMQEDGRFKMNPPLRAREDMEALREGVVDGTIDVIATDHAPHSAEEKSRGLEKSAMGVVGIETSFATVYTLMVGGGYITLERLVDIMAENPRRLLGRERGIQVGGRANLVLVDLRSEFNVFTRELLSMGKATPLAGMRLRGEVLLTIADGRIAYEKKKL
ncbi:MAG: dihydroorotase [Tidjanibacter sp.]|nr:dihydroorotase [Tidjanibacter sp.]